MCFQTQGVEEEPSVTEQLDTILNKLKNVPKSWTALTSDQQKKVTDIAYTVGSIIERDLYQDSLEVTKQSQSITSCDINKQQWLTERNSALLGFLTGCTGVNIENIEEKKTNSLIHSVEQVLNTQNLTTVSPFSFQRNLVQFTITGSKLATNLLGSWEPAGAYTKVQSFINKSAEAPKIPDGDVHMAIDNEQRVGKSSGRIRAGSNIRLDICTTMSCLQPSENGNLQRKEHLKPEMWRKRESEDLQTLLKELSVEEEKCLKTFRRYRQDFIQDVIMEVENELDADHRDHIDISLVQKERGLDNYVCCKCRFITVDPGTVCQKCGHDPNRHPLDHDVYHRSSSKHPENPPRMMIADPCMVNQNTKDNVRTVMEHVQHHCSTTGKNKSREWTYLWCDAVPYLLGSKVVEETFRCTLCGEIVMKNDKASHSALHKKEQVEFELWFGDLFFRPGPGHIELNMGRALLKMLWSPFLHHFAIVPGFRSPWAQQVIFNGVDHHRTRQILTTLLHALSKELVRPYVQQQRMNGNEADADRSFDWFEKDVRNPNYIFAWRICFTYLLAFYMYTESIRKNHHQLMIAARVGFAPLFYGRNHPRYRELHLRDMLDRVQCPTELQKNIEENESFSLPGASNKGQGCDFLQEEVNRTVKSLLPPGAVTTTTWIRVCRKADSLTQMKNRCIESSGVQSVSGKKAPKKHDHEETMFRREMHKAHLLKSPCEESKPMGILGEELDEELPNIVHTLNASYKQYKDDLQKSHKFGSVRIKQTLYITKAEREHAEAIENKTKDEITALINKLIADYGLQRQFEGSLKSNKRKTELVKLYYEVLDAAEDAELLNLTEEAEEEED